ncbi:hypothetical protein [Streptomyces sp. NPDC046805]|uniref:hypothetical protein n=1 Tax=Streptomyces sp. NPDC046805 TaxID=3155134 RepID=UPI0033E3EC65
MPTKKTKVQAMLGPLVVGVQVSGFYAGEGLTVSECLAVFTAMMLAVPLAVVGQHQGLARRVVAREAGVPASDLPPLPAGLAIRILLTLPAMAFLGFWLG